MEKFALTLQSQRAIDAHIAECHTMPYEKAILAEITAAIAAGDLEKVSWFAGFGQGFRQILMNVNHYRHALEFGFTDIAFNAYGWFNSPRFLDWEELKLEQSSISIGRGPNGVWAYALRMTYGTAGSSGPLGVFCKKFPNKDVALSAALDEMKASMSKYLGNKDTANYNQVVLQKTLKAIGMRQVSRVQLTLF